MPYLVDGSNLGGRLGGARGARDRAGVLRLLLPLARGRRRIVVVFDGPEDASLARSYGPLEVRFAAGRSADDVILAALGSRAASWHVVTADRALAAACRDRGAQTLAVEELLAVRPPKRTDRQEQEPVDVADWEEWFRRGGG